MTSSPKLSKFDRIISKFDDAGVPAVVVGGCVRDVILGVESSDIDLATPFKYKKVTKLMTKAGYKVAPTGIDHGTVTVVFGKDEKYEITTYRIDVNCKGREAEVEFVEDLAQDLARRDFTINAMAYDGNSIIDPFGGYSDLKRGILRTVGDAAKRFEEDYLRPLRGIRFQSYMPVTLDTPTLNAIYASNIASKINLGGECKVEKPVAVQRVMEEIKKAFERSDADGCEGFLQHMYNLGIIDVLLPELQMGPVPCHELIQRYKYHREGDVWTHIRIVTALAKGWEGRMFGLLHDISKPETAAWDPTGDEKQPDGWYTFHKHAKVGGERIPKIAKRLKLKNELRDKAILVTQWHLYVYQVTPSKKTVRKVQLALGDDLPLLEALGKADHMEGHKHGRAVEEHVKLYFKLPGEEGSLIKEDIPKDDIVRAKDLMEQEKDPWVPGPELGGALQAARDAQDLGELNKAVLMEIANGTRT